MTGSKVGQFFGLRKFGGGAAVTPPDPSPSPTPIMTQEVQEAKSKVRKRKKGRSENILAGGMMQSRQILNTRLGE